MTETAEHQLGTALDDLGPLIADMSDMADVCTVIAAHHRAQVASIAETDMTAKQAIKAMEHSAKLVDYCVYRLASLAVDLRDKYYDAEASQ